MSRPTRLLLVLLAGLLLLGAVGALLWSLPPIPADAQGVGIYSRASCSTINAPIVGQTVCLDQTANVWKFWNGSLWIQQLTGITAVVTDFGAVGNTQTVTDGVVSTGSSTLTSATGSFAVGDVGKRLTVAIGPALLSTSISAFGSATSVTIASSSWQNASGARVRWGTDDTTAFNTAIATLNTNQGGTLLLPRGMYWIQSSPSALPNQVTIRGAGATSSVLYCNFDTDCLRTASPVNGSTAIFNIYQDFGLLTDRPTHTGAGYADTAGTFLYLERMQFSGPFRYQVIFDQTEIALIHRVDFEMGSTNTICGIWLVAGAERTVGASAYFTNGLTIDGNQFNTSNTGATGICDDGGVNHQISNNNFNAGSNALWMSGVRGFTLINNESEGHTNSPFTFDRVTGQGAILKRPNSGGIITGNTTSDATAYHYVLNYLDSSTLTGNIGVGFVTSFINLAGGVAMGNVIGGNSKVISDANRTTPGFLQPGSANLVSANTYTQQMQTFVAAGIGAGLNTVTPATMGLTATSPALAESFAVGDVLFVENNDLTNQEFVTITAVGATTFTATFSSAKAANWLVYGMTRTQKTLGATIGAPGAGSKGDGTLTVASAIYLNASLTLWNGGTTTGTPQCTNNCGLAPSLAGTNTAMRVTMGSGTPRSPFLVLFNGAWNTTPACLAVLDTGTTASVSTVNATTTGVTVNTLTGPAAGNVFAIHCLGVG